MGTVMQAKVKCLMAVAIAAAIVGLTASAASAGLFETRSNYMGSDWSASWWNEANWAGVTAYSAEPGDGLGGDIDYIAMANDNTYLYIYFNQASAFAYSNDTQYIFFDTDLNPATGATADYWWWNSSSGGVGAEHTMYGGAIHHEATGSYTWVDNWVYGAEAGDIIIQMNLSQIGNPTSFDWTGRMFGVDDYYPDAGSYDHYVVAVPEPSSLLALALGASSLLAVRRRSRK